MTKSEFLLQFIDRAIDDGYLPMRTESEILEGVVENSPPTITEFEWSVLVDIAHDAAEWLAEMTGTDPDAHDELSAIFAMPS